MNKLIKIICFMLMAKYSSILFAQPSVSLELLKKHVQILSSDEMEGRLPGTKAYDKAANYCIEYLKSVGVMYLNGVGLNGYLQNFTSETNLIERCDLKIINRHGQIYELKGGIDFTCRGFTGSGKGVMDVVFCGYGQANNVYNDYRGMDLKGKAVMIFKSNPPFEIPNEPWHEFSIRRQVQTAKKHGASAILFVSRPSDVKSKKPFGSLLHGEGTHQLDIPQFHIDISWADTLLNGTRYPLERLDNLISNLKMPFSLFTSSKIDVNVVAQYKPDVNVYNIIGVIEGSCPKYKSEYLIISAHLDHVGKQGDVIFSGANDNASGSAAVLELARMISNSTIKPKRSVMFVLFTSEEKGLEGSKFMASNLPIPKEKISMIFNIDCIAHGDSIQVGNGESWPELWAKVKSIDEANSQLMVQQTWKGGGADLTPFHNLGIPGLYFVSKFSYTHLHQPSDKPETLNFNLFRDIVQLIYLSVFELN